MNPRISVIIPTYNEEESIERALECLAGARGAFEIVVVDGASCDSTRARVEALLPAFPRLLRLYTTERNRAAQLNHGAALARGEVFLFLHADARLSPAAVEALCAALENETIVGGNFGLIFEGDGFWSRLFTRVNRLRRAFGVYYGDSGLFVRRAIFERLGGFAPIPIMDDYEFARRLERCGRTVCLSPPVVVSDRRWRIQGVFRTVLRWFCIQGLYSLGVPAGYLARWYPPARRRNDIASALPAKPLARQATRPFTHPASR